MKRTIKILLVISAFTALATGLFGPIYAIFVEQIGGSLLDAGGAYAAFCISTGLLMLLMGMWEDRIKHQERMLVLGYFLSSIGFLGYLFVRNPLDLIIVEVIFGVSVAIINPVYDGLYSKGIEKEHMFLQWAFWEASEFIILGIAAIAGAAIAHFYGFAALFQIMLAFSLLSFLLSISLLRKKRG